MEVSQTTESGPQELLKSPSARKIHKNGEGCEHDDCRNSILSPFQ